MIADEDRWPSSTSSTLSSWPASSSSLLLAWLFYYYVFQLLLLPQLVVVVSACSICCCFAASAVIRLTEYFKPIKCFSTDVFRSNFPLRAVSELSCGTVFISTQINAKLLRCMIDRLKDWLKYYAHLYVHVHTYMCTYGHPLWLYSIAIVYVNVTTFSIFSQHFV